MLVVVVAVKLVWSPWGLWLTSGVTLGGRGRVIGGRGRGSCWIGEATSGATLNEKLFPVDRPSGFKRTTFFSIHLERSLFFPKKSVHSSQEKKMS